ncbi:P1 family peptidase [Paractinoplanes durhamensis]|uniref:P1 family peptidase n=1 Tax=Paractinoplanes durhamensis TaxID=113563 RepID=UPI001EF30DB4|nr:P1 family peptidase [Actinoplanes durhamensis]
MTEIKPGRFNSITDVAGIRVGHHERIGDGWLTGTTVVLAPPEGAVGGVDVRGGGPGTRETDLLDPRNLVERVHAVMLGGGSAFGLDAATGVMRRLADAGIGFPIGVEPGQVVPIVPAAVLFDLGRGGGWRNTPDASFGTAAYDAASDGPVAMGTVGAGTGAKAGGLKGGIGSASSVAGGLTLGAIAAVNAVGSCVDPATGVLYGLPYGLEDEFPDISPRKESPATEPGLNTTIGVVATDASLTKAQCQKLAGVAHDGLARAIRPAHSMLDGDTIFALATGVGPTLGIAEFNALLTVAADTFSRAIVHGMLAATGAGDFRGYLEG